MARPDIEAIKGYALTFGNSQPQSSVYIHELIDYIHHLESEIEDLESIMGRIAEACEAQATDIPADVKHAKMTKKINLTNHRQMC